MSNSTSIENWERRTEWPLAAVAVAFLVGYSVEVLAQPGVLASRSISVISGVTWFAFACDYVVRLRLATDRRRWFLRHLLDLIVVLLPLLRPLRLLRLLILVSALQKAVGNAIRGKVVIYTVAGAALLVYVASLAVLESERAAPDASITSFPDALWWSMTTITTVGYGDTYPVTTTGRIIAVLLMIGGISLVGTITATIASWIVQRVADDDNDNHELHREEIAELRGDIRALRAQIAAMPSPDEPERRRVSSAAQQHSAQRSHE